MSRLDPYESLGFHCNLTLKAFVAALERRLKGTKVSPAQFMALAHLNALGPLSQSSLSQLLSITHATTVRLVDRMERDGWVRRESDPDDGRANRVVITEDAVKVWEEISQTARAMLDQAYRGIHPAEIETVKRVLNRVRRNLGA
jgi:MarR family transcriptional regulator, transcriptional regulator for hemolysin